jgi:hypothetical protein
MHLYPEYPAYMYIHVHVQVQLYTSTAVCVDLMQYLNLNLGFLMKGLELGCYRKYSLLRADIDKQAVQRSV